MLECRAIQEGLDEGWRNSHQTLVNGVSLIAGIALTTMSGGGVPGAASICRQPPRMADNCWPDTGAVRFLGDLREQ